jgi:mRNA interferase RelE/StbE
MITIIYALAANKDLESFDKSVSQRIVRKINELSTGPRPLSQAKALSGNLQGLYRYRIGDYRVIFDADKNVKIIILTILKISHRKDVYR